MIAPLNKRCEIQTTTGSPANLDLLTQELADLKNHLTQMEDLAYDQTLAVLKTHRQKQLSHLLISWNRHPESCRDLLANHPDGAGHLAQIWLNLINTLDDPELSPSMDQMMDCLKAEASHTDVPSVTETGLWLTVRFLNMHIDPVYAIQSWIKRSRCLDGDWYQNRLEMLMVTAPQSHQAREELQEFATLRYEQWRERETELQIAFDREMEVLKSATDLVSLGNRPLAMAIRATRSKIQRLEKQIAKHCKRRPNDGFSPDSSDSHNLGHVSETNNSLHESSQNRTSHLNPDDQTDSPFPIVDDQFMNQSDRDDLNLTAKPSQPYRTLIDEQQLWNALGYGSEPITNRSRRRKKRKQRRDDLATVPQRRHLSESG
ncbi:MAG: hypothetical protein RJA81_360 [Planctomycetota bacterium]|jgi:hypothetical protein